MKLKVQTVIAAAAVIVGLLAVGGGLAFIKMQQIKKAAAGAGGFEPAEAVQTVTARQADWGATARLVGTVFPLRMVTLSNEVAGVVKEVLFESDMVVQPGQVLITLDASTEEADLAAAQASIRVSEAAVRAADAAIGLWEANVNRLTGAVELKAMSQTDLDNARSQLDNARAQRDKASAEIDQAKARVNQVSATIAKKTIRAPFLARTGIRNIHPGQYLAEGSTIVALQGITDDIYLDFAVPQEYAKRVQRGYTVTAVSDAFGGKPITVVVDAVDATADRNTRNIRIRSLVHNTDQRLRPGMSVDVTVPVDEPRPVILVPSTAVRRASYGDHVFLIAPSTNEKDPKGSLRAKQQFIKLGPPVGPDIIITEGLKAGDEIAAAGSFKLRDGAMVMKAPPPAPAKPGDAKPADAKPPEKKPAETKSTTSAEH
ncbi:MAG: efflux RND transporter periplasmic adaptor subunit [Phycisphaerales bacterium]